MWNLDPRTNKITMTRGDTPTFKIDISITDEEGKEIPYVPEPSDQVIFCIKKKATDEQLWAIINIPTDTMELRFKQQTTKPLQFGDYRYEISLNNDNIDYHCTFISAPLELTEELY